MKTPARARYAAPAEARRALVSPSLVPERELVKAIPSRAPHGKHPESSRLFDRHVLSPDLAPRLLELGSHLTRCWRETDSNHRSLATSPSLSHAQIDVAARHYEGHALEHRHVVKRARIHSDHIGRFA